MLRFHHLALLTFAAAALTAAHAAAQQQFKLGEDDEWSALDETAEPDSPQFQIAEARRALAEGDYRRAITLSSAFIDTHRRHELLPHAFLIRGDAKLGRGDDYKALFDYEYIARSFHGSEVWVTALERELDIAKDYARGMRRRLWGMRIIGAASEAEELFIRIQERMPGSRLGEEASMELADFYFRRRNMPLAAEAYDLFLENYPRSPQTSKARRRLIYAHLASFKGPAFDASGLNEAGHRLRELKALEPATAEEVGAEGLLLGIDESNAQKLLLNARWYHRTGDHISAELTIRRLVQRHPNTVAAREGLDLVERILPRLPQRVRDAAPDYATIRAGVDGAQATRAEQEPAS